MIQRIQSIYLLWGEFFPAITVFTPLVQFDKGDKWITLMGAGYDTVMLPEFAGVVPYGLWIFTLLSVLLPFIAIFGYKHRKKQMRTASFAIVANLLWYGALAAYTLAMQERMGATLGFEVTALFPLLAIVALIMGRRAIQRDEDLVRAADRIR